MQSESPSSTAPSQSSSMPLPQSSPAPGKIAGSVGAQSSSSSVPSPSVSPPSVTVITMVARSQSSPLMAPSAFEPWPATRIMASVLMSGACQEKVQLRAAPPAWVASPARI